MTANIQNEIPHQNTGEIHNTFINLALHALEDNLLSEEEKNELNTLVGEYENECRAITDTCRQEIQQIKNERELKNILSQTQDYKDTLSEFTKLSRPQIRDLQLIIGTPADGIFGIHSYIAYKNSPISGVFQPHELSKGRRIGNNIPVFIENFSRLHGVDTEILAIILSQDISSNSFVFLDKDGNITIFDKNNNQNIITFSEAVSLEGLVHKSLEEADLNIITKQLQLMVDKDDKKNYIKTMRNIIKEYNYQEKARQIFSKNIQDGIEIILPNTTLNKYMKAVDIFGNLQTLEVNGEVYTNTGEEFFTQTGKRLAIFNKQKLKIQIPKNEDLSQNTIPIQQEAPTENIQEIPQEVVSLHEDLEKNLSGKFGNWLTQEGTKLLGTTGRNSCGVAVAGLIDTFMRSHGIDKALNIHFARNGANFNSILEQGNICSENPFIVGSGTSITKITSPEELKRNGIDINGILHRNLTVVAREIDFPKDANPGEILVYNHGAESTQASNTRKNFGHVEIMGADNMYYSYYKSSIAGGSAKEEQRGDPNIYAKLTGFTQKAYSIEMKS